MTTEEAAAYTEEYCLAHFPDRYLRTQRFRSPEDRARSIGAGALLYEILGLEDKDIRTEGRGKPVSDRISRHFNLSHSGSLVTLAVSDAEIGVDIEQITERRKKNCLRMAGTVLTEEEKNWMTAGDRCFRVLSFSADEGTDIIPAANAASSSADPAERFLQLWTLKESAVKALGCGLSMDFGSFSVLPLLLGEPIGLGGHAVYGKCFDMPGYVFSLCTLDRQERVCLNSGLKRSIGGKEERKF